MKHFKLLISSVLLGLFVVNISFAQAVNMDKYITLKVQADNYIYLDIQGNGPAKIVSGDKEYNIDASLNPADTYLTGDTIMIIYGEVLKLDCSMNQGKVLGIDASHNTTVEELICYNNQLSYLDLGKNTALTRLECSYNRLVNLDVHSNINLEILECNYNKLANLDVHLNVNLEILECYNNQLVDLTLGQHPKLQYLACVQNNLTHLDVSYNTALTSLYCQYNQLKTLNIDDCPNIRTIYCEYNNLGSIDLSTDTALIDFSCAYNQLDSLDISHNVNLKTLVCYNNQLQHLKTGQNIELGAIWCSDNQLTQLRVKGCPKLSIIICGNNLFDTHALDVLYCDLPDRLDNDSTQAIIYPVKDFEDTNYEEVLASNAQNARDKNWAVYYSIFTPDYYDTDIPTTGTYECGEGIEEQTYTPIAIYPNPVTDILHIDTDAKEVKVQLHNLSGALVLEKTNCQYISLAHLPQGVYMLTVTTAQGGIYPKGDKTIIA